MQDVKIPANSAHREILNRLLEEFEKELKKAINTNDHVYYVLLIYLNVVSKDTTSKNQKLDEPKSL